MDIRFLTVQIIYFYLNAFASEVIGNITLSDKDAQNRYTARVVGGRRATIEHYSYNAFLDCGPGFSCGGVIIGKSWILSAGHCYSEMIIVHVGTDTEYEGLRYSVKRAIQHPSYKRTKTFAYHDYMLLELDFPLNFSDSVKSIPIGNPSDFLDGELLTLTGFGDMKKHCQIPIVKNFKQVPPNEHLRVVKFPLMVLNRCLQIKPRFASLMRLNSFCAGYEDGRASSAPGDSGSPVVFQGSLLGIVSGGSIHLWCNESPEIYSSVPYIHQWIRNVTDIYATANVTVADE